MSEMTREHLDAVRRMADEQAFIVQQSRKHGHAAPKAEARATHLYEVAAMIEAKLESRDEG